jgi:maltooligosyltrehalose trehalohydrolase
VPLLFQGEEWGASTPFQYFTDHADAALGRAVSDGRRREFAHFGWDALSVPDPQDPATFARSCLRWSEVSSEPHASMLDWYRRLVALRRSRPELTTAPVGSASVTFDEDEGWLVVDRPAPSGSPGPSVSSVSSGSSSGVAVAVNLGPAPVEVAVAGRVLLASLPSIEPVGSALRLPPDTVAVVERVVERTIPLPVTPRP